MQKTDLKKAEKKLTPMMEQWTFCKKKAKDALLLFRLGDFYEAFYEDAAVLAEALDLTLTKRQDIPMSGIPFQTAESYIEKLISQGFLVAIAEQVEDPKDCKGIVKRDVVRIVSPATIVNSSLVDEKTNNYFASVIKINQLYGLSFLDISTGEFFLIESSHQKEIVDELFRRRPSEILISEKFEKIFHGALHELKWHFSFRITTMEDLQFDFAIAQETLLQHFQTASLNGFGLGGATAGIHAAGALISYVKNELLNSLTHVQSLKKESLHKFMAVDHSTQKNLELIASQYSFKNTPTLLSLLDHSATPMGGRLFKNWLVHPLLDPIEIKQRQDAVEDLLTSPMEELTGRLKKIRDLERLIMRICMNQCTPRDLTTLRFSLEAIPKIQELLKSCSSFLVGEIQKDLYLASHENCQSNMPLQGSDCKQCGRPNLSKAAELIKRALLDDAPAKISEGRLFKKGYHPKLDELYDLSQGSRHFIAKYQANLRQALGIKSLKVSFNKAFGYFIEVSRMQAAKVPKDFIRRQTLVNAERFISPQLKEFENQIFSAEEQISQLEQKLYAELKDEIRKFKDPVLSLAKNIAMLDALLSMAVSAKKFGFVRPVVDSSNQIQISQGRHPVIEAGLPPHSFIANDVLLDDAANRLLILTGPNMAGKSTFIRQTALIVILAQTGSFVPADSARIGIVDKLFSRIGASDDLSRGHSTFMVEMMETANILHNATERSLVILDEIGRGTSTYDGISIAWATSEYLLNTIKAKTLFATHYWELTALEKKYSGVKNYTIAIEESNHSITFLRKIIPGGSDKSYGIHVGRLAGLPKEVLKNAALILKELEEDQSKKKKNKQDLLAAKEKQQQLPLFSFPSPAESALVQKLKAVDTDHITPIEALNLLVAWKNEI
ncbi:MAG: DNA mismatch repair protein MutS [Simkaniaceae bacterium]